MALPPAQAHSYGSAMTNRARAEGLPGLLLAAVLLAGCSALPFGGFMGHPATGMSGGMMGPVGGNGNGTGSAGPGSAGFVAGNPSTPRVVAILAGPGFQFTPSTVDVAAGETITFEVTAVGPTAHEFKVGPLAIVLADGNVPEIAAIGMMQTRSLTYTFAGAGPFGFACHEPGHLEAGMQGRVVIVAT